METAVAIVGLAVTIMGLIGTAIYLWLKAKFDQFDKHIDEEHNDRAEDQRECSRKRAQIFEKIEIIFKMIEKNKQDIQEEKMNRVQKFQKIEIELLKLDLKNNKRGKND